MATFLFLVSLSSIATLLIASAADELARLTRGLFARRSAAREFTIAASITRPVAAHVGEVAALPSALVRPPRSRPVASNPGDWDRAA